MGELDVDMGAGMPGVGVPGAGAPGAAAVSAAAGAQQSCAAADAQQPLQPALLQRVREGMLLYAITDSSWLEGRSLEACVAAALEGGATFLQLREKQASTAELVELGRPLKRLCARAHVPFVVNDDVEAARLLDADGVHVGQEDASCARAREVLGPQKIVGVSAQTLDQALAAQAAGASYVGVGAMFGTPTKPEAAEVSRDELRAITQALSIPVVAIGGLNCNTIGSLSGLGVDGAAVVSAIFAASDIAQATRDLRAVCERTFARVGR